MSAWKMKSLKENRKQMSCCDHQCRENETESFSLSLRGGGVGVLRGFLGLVRGANITASVVLRRSYDVLLAKWKI